MLITMARLAGIEKADADELAKTFRREACEVRRKNKDIRSRLFEAVFSAYGLKAKFAEYPRYSESPRPIKGEYHFALAELFAAKWKENRSEMEKLCAKIGLDGYTAASLAG